MNICNYSMNVGLLGLAREMDIIIPTSLAQGENNIKFYKTFSINVKRLTEPFKKLHISFLDFNWISIKNKDMMFVSSINFNIKVSPALWLFYIMYHPFIIQIYFNPY